MDALEIKEESYFDEKDKEFIERLKKKNKEEIIIYLIIITTVRLNSKYSFIASASQ